jgi:hypothetical protein
MQALAYLLSRFSEPSSYAGLGAVLALAGLHFSDTDLGQAAQFLAAGCGLAALLLRERGTLSACGPLVAAGAATGAAGGGLAIASQVVGTVDATIQTACSEYQKGRAAANAVVGTGLLPSGAAAKVGVIEEYGDAACASPPPGDALSTAIWLGELVGQIGTLTSADKAQP